MARYIRTSLLCLVVLAMHLACAPKWVGPTAPSGYYCSLQASDITIWLMLSGSKFADHYPRTTELVVSVKDEQGRPVNGVPVTFQVESAWAHDATVMPPHAITQKGKARAVLEVEMTGLVHVMAQVENKTETVAITVSPPPEVGATSAD